MCFVRQGPASQSEIMARSSGEVRLYSIKRDEFSKSKLAMALDYIFGKGTSRSLDFSKLDFQYSNRTGRLKYVRMKDSRDLLFTLRANGSIAPTVAGYKMLLPKHRPGEIRKRPFWSITVTDGVSDFVSNGRTVFCKHVVGCNDILLPGEDVAIMSERGDLLATGRSILSGRTIKQFKRGAAVKVREGSRKIAANEPG